MNPEAKNPPRAPKLVGLPLKIIIFYARNPDEMLMTEDVCRKWGCTYAAAQKALYRLRAAGWLAMQRENHISGRPSVYEAGATLRNELQT